MKTAKALLFAIPSTNSTKNTWLQIGQSLRSINPDLLESWCQWSASSNDMNFNRKACINQWGKFRPCTTYDLEDVRVARKKESELAEALKSMHADEITGGKSGQ